MYEVLVNPDKKYSICRFLDDESVDYIVEEDSNGYARIQVPSDYVDKVEEMNVG